MKQPEIDIKIDKTGRVTVTVSGISGEPCLKLSDAITQIIGKLESRELTPEYRAEQWQSTTRPEQHVRTRFD